MVDPSPATNTLDKAKTASAVKAGFGPWGLSGKLLVFTMVFIMLAEILIFVPSVANFRLTWLARHFNTGEAASLALEKLPAESVSDEMRIQLLSLTQTEMIVVRRDGASSILATDRMPSEIARHVELSAPNRTNAFNTIMEAFDTLLSGGERSIRVFGPMVQRSGTLELVMKERPLRDAMLGYARNVLIISLLLSITTAFLVFLVLRWFLIRPIQQLTGAMLAFAEDPEDAAHLVKPSGRQDEIGVAEEQFGAMQNQLRGTLKQQRHLADLGLAVSKINHDLRNILAAASLFTDRLTIVADPTVKRLAPRLIKTIDRAVDYTTSVLAYGKAGEAVPNRNLLHLHRVCEDVAEALALDLDNDVEWANNVEKEFEVEADAEQLFRVLLNLSRNAVQAMNGSDNGAIIKRLTVQAGQSDTHTHIQVIDTGPGFPESAKEKLFSAFQTVGRKGGTGLGLTIAAELVQAHGGTIKLVDTTLPGTQFEISLPRTTTAS